MDPQQRLLLHAAYESFVDGGAPPDLLADRSVGVFVGVSAIDYAALAQAAVMGNSLGISPYMGPAWSMSIAANRISYCLDLEGPSVALDTACSSSLVAFDQAVTSVRAGVSSAALVAGVNVQLRRVWSDAFVTAGMLSPHSRCRFGDDAADGYVRGEGVGAALVMPLDLVPCEAAAFVYALVAGGGVNQDGKSNGLTAPNPAAQASLLRRAYARIDRRETEYVEAHGTGTRLGDPIEISALGQVLGSGYGARGAAAATPEPRRAPLLTGSVKSNIGHLECAAGIASLVKAAQIASKLTIPRTIHVTVPNRLIDFDRLGVTLALSETPLGVTTKLPHIGISGFGFGGTNAHAVLLSYEQERDTADAVLSRSSTYEKECARLGNVAHPGCEP